MHPGEILREVFGNGPDFWLSLQKAPMSDLCS